MTPLHSAAKGGHLEVVRCLLLSGAEPDLPNKVIITPSISALSSEQIFLAICITNGVYILCCRMG